VSRAKSESLLGLTETFFYSYLQHTRGASAHTVRAYRDTLKLFFLFLADQKRKAVADLTLGDIQSDAVLLFWSMLSRGAGTPLLRGTAVLRPSAVVYSICSDRM
jgi:hypothetical protein